MVLLATSRAGSDFNCAPATARIPPPAAIARPLLEPRVRPVNASTPPPTIAPQRSALTVNAERPRAAFARGMRAASAMMYTFSLLYFELAQLRRHLVGCHHRCPGAHADLFFGCHCRSALSPVTS